MYWNAQTLLNSYHYQASNSSINACGDLILGGQMFLDETIIIMNLHCVA